MKLMLKLKETSTDLASSKCASARTLSPQPTSQPTPPQDRQQETWKSREKKNKGRKKCINARPLTGAATKNKRNITEAGVCGHDK